MEIIHYFLYVYLLRFTIFCKNFSINYPLGHTFNNSYLYCAYFEFFSPYLCTYFGCINTYYVNTYRYKSVSKCIFYSMRLNFTSYSVVIIFFLNNMLFLKLLSTSDYATINNVTYVSKSWYRFTV